MDFEQLRACRDIVVWLNTKKYPPRDIINSTYSYGVIVKQTITPQQPHFSCLYRDGFWYFYCDSPRIWFDKKFQKFKNKIMRDMLISGLRCKFEFTHTITVGIIARKSRVFIVQKALIHE